MNKKSYNIEEEVEKTLESMDAIQRVEGNPFLFTRLQERLKQEQEGKAITRRTRIPVWQIAMVAMLLFINAFTLLQSGYLSNSSDNVATIDDFATEYFLTENEEDLDYFNWNE